MTIYIDILNFFTTFFLKEFYLMFIKPYTELFLIIFKEPKYRWDQFICLWNRLVLGGFALGVVLNHILGPFYIFCPEPIGSERMVRLASRGGDVLLNIIFFKYIY